jgi:hypothetical protein
MTLRFARAAALRLQMLRIRAVRQRSTLDSQARLSFLCLLERHLCIDR